MKIAVYFFYKCSHAPRSLFQEKRKVNGVRYTWHCPCRKCLVDDTNSIVPLLNVHIILLWSKKNDVSLLRMTLSRLLLRIHVLQNLLVFLSTSIIMSFICFSLKHINPDISEEFIGVLSQVFCPFFHPPPPFFFFFFTL